MARTKQGEDGRLCGSTPLPADEARRNQISVRLTDDELTRVFAAASDRDQPLATYLRESGLSRTDRGV